MAKEPLKDLIEQLSKMNAETRTRKLTQVFITLIGTVTPSSALAILRQVEGYVEFNKPELTEDYKAAKAGK